MTPSEFLVGRIADGLVFTIVGRGTMRESPTLRGMVAASPAVGMVMFDARQCEYVDSTFLGCLIWIKKECERAPPRRFVIVASETTRIRLFSTSSLYGYFDFVDDCPAPLGALLNVDVEKIDSQELGRHIMRCHELLADMGGAEAKAFQAVAHRLAKELGEPISKPVSE